MPFHYMTKHTKEFDHMNDKLGVWVGHTMHTLWCTMHFYVYNLLDPCFFGWVMFHEVL